LRVWWNGFRDAVFSESYESEVVAEEEEEARNLVKTVLGTMNYLKDDVAVQ